MIGLTDEMLPGEEDCEPHRLLRGLLFSEMSVEEKMNVIKEYDIETDNSMLRENLKTMYTLSQGVWEKGKKKE